MTAQPPPDAPGKQAPPPLVYYGSKPPPPPQYAPAFGGYQPLAPKRKGIPTGIIVLIVVGVLLVVAVAVGRTLSGGAGTGSASRDVSVSECTSNRFTGPEATLSVTNSSSSSSDYIIKVEFLDGSTRLGSRTVTVRDLAPGQTEQPRAVAFRPTTSTTFSCSVTSVTRF